MEITLSDIGKKYKKEWIFKGVDLSIEPQSKSWISGNNGSGKSTLLQIISGKLIPTKGKIEYRLNQQLIEESKIYTKVSLVTPYLDLFEDLTLQEMLAFHFKFKSLKKGLVINDIPDLCQLGKAKNKFLKEYSSGMKQRVKLALAIFADTELLLLDEPLSNLDQSGMDWYSECIDTYCKENTILVCSNNQKQEFDFCTKQINIEDYK